MCFTKSICMLMAILLALSLAFFPGSANADGGDQCDPGDTLIAMDADHIWCRRNSEYQGSDAEKMASQFCLTKKTIAADENAIQQLGFSTDAERFSAFEKVAKDQHDDLVRKVWSEMIDRGLDSVGAIANNSKSLNPWNVNTAVKMTEAKWYGSPLLTAALRRMSKVKGKPDMAAAYSVFAQLTKSAKDGYLTGQDMRKDPDSSQLQLLVGVLKVLQGDEELGLTVTTVEFGESVAYLVYVGNQVDDLASASDDKLARLPMLNERLKGHVDDLAEARQTWQQTTGIPVDPICPSSTQDEAVGLAGIRTEGDGYEISQQRICRTGYRPHACLGRDLSRWP